MGPEHLQELIPGKFPHHPFALHCNRAYRLQALPKNTSKKQFGFWAFSNSAPKLWNALPQTTVEADSLVTFLRHWKTHLFCEWLHQISLKNNNNLFINQVNGIMSHKSGHHHHHHQTMSNKSKQKRRCPGKGTGEPRHFFFLLLHPVLLIITHETQFKNSI